MSEDDLGKPIKRLIIEEPPRHGKALRLNTPIPTPDGWKRISELRPGDFVFAGDGTPTRVVAVSPIWRDRECYKISTELDCAIVADAQHEWIARLDKRAKVYRKHTTEKLAGRKSPAKPLVDCHPGLKLPEAKLPIPPYTLGVWLGDGCSSSAYITQGSKDRAFVVRRIEADGFVTRPHADVRNTGILGLSKLLRAAGLFNNKHIPNSYLRASAKQRIALLQGLVDTDGYVAKHGQVEFVSIKLELARGVAELVRSLGVKCSISRMRAKLRGKDCGPKYSVLFYFKEAASLPRKKALCRNNIKCPGHYLRLQKVRNASTVCIQVEHPSHTFLAGEAMVPTCNSELASKYFSSWHQGTYPNRDLILTSATDDLALDFSQASLDLLIEHGPGIFGQTVRKDSRARHRWQMDVGGCVRAAGIGGAIMGRGANGLLVDDYLKNMEEALSEARRDKIYKWFLSTASTRLAPDGWIVIIATRWHRKDLIGLLLEDAAKGGEKWCRLRLPALAEANDPLGRSPGEALWPERFSRRWLLGVRNKFYASGYGWMWEALYQQNPPEVLDAEFDADYFPDSMWFENWPTLDSFVHRIQTCDPSLGQSDKSDYQAHINMALDKDGVMWVEADLRRRDRVQIVSDMFDLAKWFRPEAVGIESNMWQVLLADQLYEQSKASGMALPIWPMTNWENKRVRIRATLTPYLARKEFRFRNTPGTRLLVEQLRGFPSCKYDDGPDSLELAVRLMRDIFQRGVEGRPHDDTDEQLVSHGIIL